MLLYADKPYVKSIYRIYSDTNRRACGLMDKVSDFGSEDCRFESCHARWIYFFVPKVVITAKSVLWNSLLTAWLAAVDTTTQPL